MPKAKQGLLSYRVKRAASRMFLYAVMTGVAVVMLFPFLWMLSSSFKTSGETFVYPPVLVPKKFVWKNYAMVTQVLPFLRLVYNSFEISVASTLGTLLSCSLAAFAFARMRFPGRNALFMIFLSTLMIPMQVKLIPIFVLMAKLGWINTHLPLIVPSFFGGAFGIFLLRQFFLSVPRELEDAARIDGCGPFGIYWRIFLPLSKPALATLAIFTFMWSWNNLLGPIIYLHSVEKYTLTAAIAFLRDAYSSARYFNATMAGVVLSCVPLLILYFAAQKYFVKGVVLTGLKG